MKKFIFFIILSPGILFSYPRIKNPATPIEVQQDLQDLSDDIKNSAGKVSLVLTLAQINAYSVGVPQIVYCSDCSVTPVCISTGTGTGAFSSLTSKTTHCN